MDPAFARESLKYHRYGNFLYFSFTIVRATHIYALRIALIAF